MLLTMIVISSLSFGVLVYKNKEESLSHLFISVLSSIGYGAILFFLVIISLGPLSIIRNLILMILLVVPVYYLMWSLFQK